MHRDSARAVPGDHMRIGHGAGHQPRFAATRHAQRLATVLEHPVQAGPARDLLPTACSALPMMASCSSVAGAKLVSTKTGG